MRVPTAAKLRRPSLESLEARQLMAADLQITEINYHPYPAMLQFGDRDVNADEFEFVEVANLGDAGVNLAGYKFAGGIQFRFGSQWLAPGEHLVVTKDLKDFRSRYGDDVPIALGNDGEGGDGGEYQGSLNNSGETIVLNDAANRPVQQFTYFDTGEWPTLADGHGSSLEVMGASQDLNDPKSWRASGAYGGSPGAAGEGMRGDVVINELLTHTDLPQIDTIELANVTDEDIDMSGWYLTDTSTDIFRFQFEGSAATIRQYDYRAYDEEELGFSFRGQEADDVYLIESDLTGRPTRFVDVVSFGATQNGVSLGRWDDGVGELFPMEYLSFEDYNEGPLIGDVVISEVHYHPAAPPIASGLTETELEFVEIANRTDAPVDIGNWQLSEAVSYEYPAGTMIESGETLVTVGFDPVLNRDKASAFRDTYGLSRRVPLFGPYSDADDPNADQLDDDGERLILERPEDILQLGLGYVLVDRVIYQDQGEWPMAADGAGASLRRAELDGYGDFSSTWVASEPAPGIVGLRGDVNEDGTIDASDIDLTCTATNQGEYDPVFDLNGDGIVSSQDARYLVTSILDTSPGDANLDGSFNSEDFVFVFIAGEYNDGIESQSGWAAGDWNCDREFDSNDIVDAFIFGGYDSTAATPTGATPTLAASARDVRWDRPIGNDRITEPTDPSASDRDEVSPMPVEAQAVDRLFADFDGAVSSQPLQQDSPQTEGSLAVHKLTV